MIACTVGRVYCLLFTVYRLRVKRHTENTETIDILKHTDLTDLTDTGRYAQNS